MAKNIRIDSIGFYHVINSGMHKDKVLATIIEKEKFLKIICKACEVYNVVLHNYCLLGNKFELSIETRRANLA